MLTEMRYKDRVMFKYFWTPHPEEFADGAHGEYVETGEVDEDAIFAHVDLAEEAYCGEGSSIRQPDELAAFALWLVECGYAYSVAFAAASKLAELHGDD